MVVTLENKMFFNPFRLGQAENEKVQMDSPKKKAVGEKIVIDAEDLLSIARELESSSNIVHINGKECPMIFGELPDEHVAKRENIRITWQDDVKTDSTFTWYESKGELRLTRLGRGFPYLKPEETGALFVFSRVVCSLMGKFVVMGEGMAFRVQNSVLWYDGAILTERRNA